MLWFRISGAASTTAAQRLFLALEVGREDLDARARRLQANLADHLDKRLRGAQVVVVAVDAGDDRMRQPKLRHRIRDAARLVEVDRLRPALGHRAKAAAPRAQVAEHHERGGLLVPALANVGAVRGLAHGMQVQLARHLLQRVEGLAARRLRLQPLRLARRHTRAQVDLDEIERGSHALIVCAPKEQTQSRTVMNYGSCGLRDASRVM